MPTASAHALLRAARQATDSDAQLLARFAVDRDEAAFAELVRRHGPLVRGTTRRVAGHPDAADDAFQAAFLLLARKAAAGGWGPNVGPWLYRVACRVSAKARARTARRPTVPLAGDVPAPPCDPAAGLVHADVCAALDAALAALPARLRDPLVLCDLEGLPRDEAAAALGCSPTTLKGRVSRGRDRLRRALAARGLALPTALSGAVVAVDGVSADAAAALARTAAAYRATGAAPPTVLPLLGGAVGGWVPAAVLVGMLLACGTVVLSGAGSSPPAAGPVRADPLMAGAAVPLGSADLRHPNTLTELRFSPDGRELISFGNGVTRRWAARTGRPVRSAAADVHIAYNWTSRTADGTAVVAIEPEHRPPNGQVVRRYDAVTGRHNDLFPLPARKNPNSEYAAMFAASPDGTLLARGDDGTVTVWDLQTRAVRFTIEPPGVDYCYVQFSPDGAHLMTARGPGRWVRFWDVRTGKEARTLTRAGGRFPESVLGSVVVAPDGRRVAGVDNTHLHDHGTELTVWDLDRPGPDRPLVVTVPEGFGHMGTVAFGRDGTVFTVTAPFERWLSVVTKWDGATGERLAQWSGPRSSWRGGMSTAVSPDGSVIAVGTDAGVIRLYDATDGKELVAGGGHAAGVFGVTFDPNGREVRTVAEDGSVVAWDAGTGEARTRRGPPTVERMGETTGALLSADGRWVLTQQARNWDATLWDAATGERRTTWKVAGQVWELLTVPGGNLLIGRYNAGGKHRLQAWDTTTGAALPAIDRQFEPDRARYAVSADGQSLVTCDGESVVGYDLRTGRERFAWKPADRGVLGSEGRVLAVAVSPDGTTLAVSIGGPAYTDRTKRTDNLVLVTAATGAVVRRVPTPEPAAGWLVFSPDGRRLASSRCVWDVATLTEVLRFPDRPEVRAAAFSPDGRRVATGHANGTATIWPAGGP